MTGANLAPGIRSWQIERDNLLDALSESLKARDRALTELNQFCNAHPEHETNLNLTSARLELLPPRRS